MNDQVCFVTVDPETSVDPALVLNSISGLVCSEITSGDCIEKSSPFTYLEKSLLCFETGRHVSVGLCPAVDSEHVNIAFAHHPALFR